MATGAEPNQPLLNLLDQPVRQERLNQPGLHKPTGLAGAAEADRINRGYNK